MVRFRFVDTKIFRVILRSFFPLYYIIELLEFRPLRNARHNANYFLVRFYLAYFSNPSNSLDVIKIFNCSSFHYSRLTFTPRRILAKESPVYVIEQTGVL